MEEMPNQTEALERVAREAERLKIILVAEKCKSIEELLEKLHEMQNNSK